MALGDTNVNQNKAYSPSYYSRWSIKQKDGKYRLSPSSSSGLLKISIQEQGEGYHWNDVANITLSPAKAKTFAAELEEFMKAYFVDGGCDGRAFGVDTGIKDVRPIIAATSIEGIPYIVIGKIDTNGNFESRFDYQINVGYHYGLEWSNFDKMEVSKQFYDRSELEQLRDLCLVYAESAFGAMAASTLEMMKWDYSITRNVDAIAEKLGVERRTGGNATSTGNSFFNKQTSDNYGGSGTGARTNRVSMDDLEID